MKPFLKWPGGKQWLTNRYIDLFPSNYDKYYEPFLGGASVFFALSPKQSVISDINEELINLYKVMRDNPSELALALSKHNINHSKDYYYSIRAQICLDPIDKAARTLYLNRTCFNGIYRVNKKGNFNVPIGTKTNCVYDIGLFNEYSDALNKCEIIQCDFVSSIQSTKKNDLLFADPPYTASTDDGCFIKYNDNLFSWNDQLRLHKELLLAKNRGTYVVSTNKDNHEIEQLYLNSGFYVRRLHRSSCIKAKKVTNSPVTELFITSYKLSEELAND